MTAGTLVLALAFFGLLPLPQAPAGNGDAATLTATSTNVAEPGSPVRIRIFRWSTDEERNPFLTALNPPARGAGPGAGERGGAARGGRAAAPARGRARGPAAPLTPAAALAAAAGRSPTIGYVWTNDITGYSIKYAYRAPQPDGGERIVLLTDRRLGAHSAAWKPAASGAETDYEFTLVEIRLDAKGVGEGKTSLMTRVVAENEAKTVALENYAATATILQNVKR